MKAFSEFSINLKSLKVGVEQLDYRVDRSFFNQFEGAAIEECEILVRLDLEKRNSMIVLDFEFSGFVKTECDRCLEPIDLPVEGEQQFLLKFRDVPGEEDNVIYIPESQPFYNVAPLVFEIIQLGVPLRKVLPSCDEDKSHCNGSVLGILGKVEKKEKTEESEEKPSPWEELKKLKEK